MDKLLSSQDKYLYGHKSQRGIKRRCLDFVGVVVMLPCLLAFIVGRKISEKVSRREDISE